MRDMKAHLEKLQVQIAECEIIRDLATDHTKRELFGRLAEHYRVLAAEVEKAIIGERAKNSAAEANYSLEAKRFRDKAAEADQLAEIAQTEARREALTHIAGTYLRTAQQLEELAKTDESLKAKEVGSRLSD